MAVKIFIRRHCREGQAEQVLKRLSGFRKAAMDQPGYLSGESLVNHYDPRCLVVVSTWRDVDDWIGWQESPERAERESDIEELLDQPTTYEIFDIGGPAG
jgi:heme-degrading monooxygenase HmoA